MYIYIYVYRCCTCMCNEQTSAMPAKGFHQWVEGLVSSLIRSRHRLLLDADVPKARPTS